MSYVKYFCHLFVHIFNIFMTLYQQRFCTNWTLHISCIVHFHKMLSSHQHMRVSASTKSLEQKFTRAFMLLRCDVHGRQFWYPECGLYHIPMCLWVAISKYLARQKQDLQRNYFHLARISRIARICIELGLICS